MKTRTLTFHGLKLAFAEYEGRWVIPARLLGKALNYSKDGQKLLDVITSRWSASWLDEDLRVVQGEQLAALKKQVQWVGIPPQSGSLMLLTMSGVWRVLQKSGVKPAKEFREMLLKEGADLMASVALPLAHPPPARGSVRGSVLELPRGTLLEDYKKLVFEMWGRKLISDKECRAHLERMGEVLLAAMAREHGLSSGAPHQMPEKPAPVAPETTSQPKADPASSSEPEFVRGVLGLPANKGVLLQGKHPKYRDWLSAAEIAQPLMRFGNDIKHHIKAYCTEKGEDLPNNDAVKYVTAHGGQLPVDVYGYWVFHAPKVGGYAKWSLKSGNVIVWTNVWSPKAVEAIRARVLAADAKKEAEFSEKVLTMISPRPSQASLPLRSPLPPLDQERPSSPELPEA